MGGQKLNNSIRYYRNNINAEHFNYELEYRRVSRKAGKAGKFIQVSYFLLEASRQVKLEYIGRDYKDSVPFFPYQKESLTELLYLI